eukprot:scaffold2058_cov115-Isochrysis_galbana.AAC.12
MHRHGRTASGQRQAMPKHKKSATQDKRTQIRALGSANTRTTHTRTYYLPKESRRKGTRGANRPGSTDLQDHSFLLASLRLDDVHGVGCAGAARCASSLASAVQTLTAFVKKKRFDCDRMSLPPGRRTRATSRITCGGRRECGVGASTASQGRRREPPVGWGWSGRGGWVSAVAEREGWSGVCRGGRLRARVTDKRAHQAVRLRACLLRVPVRMPSRAEGCLWLMCGWRACPVRHAYPATPALGVCVCICLDIA